MVVCLFVRQKLVQSSDALQTTCANRQTTLGLQNINMYSCVLVRVGVLASALSKHIDFMNK